MGPETPLKLLRGLLGDKRGTAAVELAIVLPFLMIMLFGLIEIGRALYHYHAVTKSVRDATRYLTRVGMTCAAAGNGPLANYLDSATDETTAKNLVLSGHTSTPVAASDYLLAYWTDPNTITGTVNCVNNANQYSGVYNGIANIPVITLTANVPFSFLWGSVFLNRDSVTFTISHSEVHVGE
jgi:Flp pilus assembly protein TadG